MGYLVIVIGLLALYVALHNFTELSHKTKIISMIGLVILIALFTLYQQSNNKAAKENQALVHAFMQGESLECGGKEVNNTLYNYASRSFVGKKGTKAFGSVPIALDSCK